MKYHHQQDGFIILTAVIILSIVLLLLAQTLSTAGYLQRRGISDFEYKEQSYYLALSCADKALYKLDNDLDYVGNETFTIKTFTCTIDPITTEGVNTVIRTWAVVGQSKTKLKITTDAYLNIVSFAEE